jgi:formylglycine-generating enzyme required for sulfatase activity
MNTRMALTCSTYHHRQARKISLCKFIFLTVGLLAIVLRSNLLLAQTNSPQPPGSTYASSVSTGPKVGQMWTNSLGMVFKPVPGTRVLFNRYDTTVEDYRAFVQATGRKQIGGIAAIAVKINSTGRQTLAWPINPSLSWENPGFTQGPTSPAVGVSWDDAIAFCAWLTQKEQTEGKLEPKQIYRLPTDAEWTTAAGTHKYAWGDAWPPPAGSANYADECFAASLPGHDWPSIPGNDGYARTSPVGSFAANQYGLYDMGGNVWQWCMDWYLASMNSTEVRAGYPAFNKDGGGHTLKVLRGGSWRYGGPATLAIGYHDCDMPGSDKWPAGRRDRTGFRVVVVIPAS